jgi:hypothetical protein
MARARPTVGVVALVEGGEHHFVVPVLRARHIGGELRPGEEVAEARWVGPRVWADLDLVEGTKKVLTDLRRARPDHM